MTTKKVFLTPKKVRGLIFIIDYIGERGYAPTYKEIADAIGSVSTNSAHNVVSTLEKLGLIEKEKNRPRSIEVTDLGKRFAKKGREYV